MRDKPNSRLHVQLSCYPRAELAGSVHTPCRVTQLLVSVGQRVGNTRVSRGPRAQTESGPMGQEIRDLQPFVHVAKRSLRRPLKAVAAVRIRSGLPP